MRRTLITSLILFSNLAFASVPDKTPAEYLRICSLYGAGWYYLPKSTTCVFDSSGETRVVTLNGVVHGKTQLAYRVAQLESAAFGSVQASDDQPAASAGAPIQYVELCPLYGNGWYYIPGSDTCENPLTGETKKQTGSGTVTGQTQLSYRISQLETKLLGAPQTFAATKNSVTHISPAYVELCNQQYGDGWYYLPGSTKTCLFPATGETRRETDHHGTIIGQSQLAQRVSQLEQQLADNL